MSATLDRWLNALQHYYECFNANNEDETPGTRLLEVAISQSVSVTSDVCSEGRRGSKTSPLSSDPCGQDLASLLVEIAFLLDPSQLDLHPLKFILQVSIRRLEVVTLLQPLATAILSVATVLQGPSLLLQTHDLRRTGGSVLRTNSMEDGAYTNLIGGESVLSARSLLHCLISLLISVIPVVSYVETALGH
ncbi:hypothetical protein WN48_08270 [Eufriesea mexicana]|nr:hypothetical protein WN48_08270 [Eufriesea mexicana]